MNYVPPPDKQLFYEQVWALVKQIPSGRVATYGQISKLLPKPDNLSVEVYEISSPRWVGLAMAACPDDVPWQRVVNAKGMISHPEAARQEKLLEQEGVFFSGRKVDLGQYQWCSPGQREEPVQGLLF